MEKLRKAVSEIAYAQNHAKLTHLQLSLIPVLHFASFLYKLALFLRRSLYHYGLFRKHRLPVPAISVGNLTWVGNGKTPTVEFIALFLADSGISPLTLTRIGAFNVDHLEFSDHHIFQAKDYDRDPEIFKHLDPYEVLALCSELKIIPHRECTEDGFKTLLKGDLKDELQGTNRN